MFVARKRSLRRVVGALLLAPVLLKPAVGLAEEHAAAADGARVRVTAPTVSRLLFKGDAGRRLVGNIVSQDAGSLTVRTGDLRDPAVVPRSSIRKLEISRRRSQRAKGLLIGFLAGTAAGVGLTAINEGSSACESTGVSGCDVLLGAVLLGVPAGLLGAILAPGEQWEEVGSPVAIGLTPAPGGGVGISLRWTPSRTARPEPRDEAPSVLWTAAGPPPPLPAARSFR